MLDKQNMELRQKLYIIISINQRNIVTVLKTDIEENKVVMTSLYMSSLYIVPYRLRSSHKLCSYIKTTFRRQSNK